MANYKARGLEQRHEQDQRQLIRDTRTLLQRFVDFFGDPTNVVMVLVGFSVAGFFIPALVDLLFLTGVFSFMGAYFRKTTLPFRLPLSSHMLDYNDPPPGSKKPQMARGISFFGNDITDVL